MKSTLLGMIVVFGFMAFYYSVGQVYALITQRNRPITRDDLGWVIVFVAYPLFVYWIMNS